MDGASKLSKRTNLLPYPREQSVDAAVNKCLMVKFVKVNSIVRYGRRKQ